ncbi:PREDICTED: uncharacterized protein LOC105125927 [Populus euphratica]|uniref:Rab3 GTPase-activating protein catalytic subunit n=1 Tax=Populus euphratica TaxID=75702 RepID=A0AAJ6U926_POPEU|nr:PREDICTED: uncharacterized protein LOC105125927 [Populus euphratica]
MKHVDTVSDLLKSSDHNRRGSAGVAGSMELLKLYQSMHGPFTQEAPLITEDMHEERLQAVEASGNSFHSKQQTKMLSLKILFGGIHRGDWDNDGSKERRPSKSPGKKGLKDDWPPLGRLSQQMSEQGNLWHKIWNGAPALPAYE